MKFRKKPVVIDAVQWTGGNYVSIENFLGSPRKGSFTNNTSLVIHTIDGDVRAWPGDWIIRGVQGEFYPCKKDIFEQTYEAVSE